jgi:hypothetical protein
MRWFGYIFSAMILLFSLMPCGDAENCTDPVRVAASADHSTHEHATDTCSPFCSCACCVVHVVTANPVAFSVFIPVQSSAGPEPEIKSYPVIALPIWQPPQLG